MALFNCSSLHDYCKDGSEGWETDPHSFHLTYHFKVTFSLATFTTKFLLFFCGTCPRIPSSSGSRMFATPKFTTMNPSKSWISLPGLLLPWMTSRVLFVVVAETRSSPAPRCTASWKPPSTSATSSTTSTTTWSIDWIASTRPPFWCCSQSLSARVSTSASQCTAGAPRYDEQWQQQAWRNGCNVCL